METIIKIAQSKAELARDLAAEFADMALRAALRKKPVAIALSGGNTPHLLFSVLGDSYTGSRQWDYVHFFWGDERCVPPHDSESNFGMTDRVFLEKTDIPKENIHRIRGEDDPEKEAERYSEEIRSHTRTLNSLPVFDLIILGLGEDGHTASIFPGDSDLLTSEKICAVAKHPLSGQKRITVTGPVINNADTVIFMVTGTGKAELVADIIDNPGIVDYPAASVEPVHGVLKWYLDLDASSLLSQWA